MFRFRSSYAYGIVNGEGLVDVRSEKVVEPRPDARNQALGCFGRQFLKAQHRIGIGYSVAAT